MSTKFKGTQRKYKGWTIVQGPVPRVWYAGDTRIDFRTWLTGQTIFDVLQQVDIEMIRRTP